MPLALDPKATFKVVLDSDRDKKPAPAFTYRYLTGAEQLDFAMITDRIDEAKDSAGPGPMMDEIFKMAQVGLVGWENMIDPGTNKKIPFAASKLKTIITMAEAQELTGLVFESCLRVSVDVKKKLDSQSGSVTGKSAKRAGARKSAKINRRPPHP